MPPIRKKKTQTTTKKPLAEKMDENELIDDAVTTDPRDDVITKLQEEIHRLKLENASLRKSVDEKKTVQNASTPKARRVTEIITPMKVRRNSTNSTQSMKQKERGCSCTGSCVNKKCGCVKKDSQCTEYCKCSDSCQNQMTEIDEDKENEDDENTVIVENKKVSKPNASKPSSSDSETKSPTSYSRENSENTSYSSNASSQTDMDEGNSPRKRGLNPMKPTRQLQRSPLQVPKSSPNTTSNTTNTTANTTVFNEDEVFLPMPKIEAEDELPPPDEIHQMEVNWDEHQANLVQCRKCKRTFHAYRIKKHEQSCKKI